LEFGQLRQLLRALRLQLLDTGLGRLQRQTQTHGPLHQQISGIGLGTDRFTDQLVCRGVFRVGSGLAQSAQKLLQLVSF
jgi:hypothetical protein